MSRTPRPHRVLVVLPAFLAMLGMSFSEAGGSSMLGRVGQQGVAVSGHVMASERDATFHTSAGLSGVLRPGGEADVRSAALMLAEGDLLLRCEGFCTVRAGTASVYALAGALQTVRRGQDITVAAVSSPVLVSLGGSWTLVPVGYQWKLREAPSADVGDGAAWMAARAFLELPDAYRQETLRRVRDLPVAVSVSVPRPWTGVADALRLPSAQRRSVEIAEESAVRAFIRAAHAGDDRTLRAALADPAVRSALAQASREDLSLAVAGVREAPFLLEVLSFLLRDPAAATLAALHPELRDAAWVAGVAFPSDAQLSAIRLLQFPAADALPVSAQPLTAERWSQDGAEFLAGQSDPLAFAATFQARMRAQIALFTASALPERAARYAQLSAAVLAPYAAFLPPERQEEIRRWATMDPPPPPVQETEPAPPSAARHLSAPGLSIDEVERRATEALQGAGAILSADSTLAAMDGTAARVSGAVFATPRGERSASFVYDVVRDEVREASIDGRELPYAMPLTAFAEWMRAGAVLGAGR